MDIIIDAYNLMWTTRTLNPVARFNFGKAARFLERLISIYSKKVEENVILVFDGYKSGHPYTRHENRDGLEVVITGKGITADDWIIEQMQKHHIKGSVVTSDKEIKDAARKNGVNIITSRSFENELMETLKSNRELMDELHELKREYKQKHKRRNRKKH
ncbi:MAG: NYN domain-containing protein [Vulcanimicrobiota bacterium]